MGKKFDNPDVPFVEKLDTEWIQKITIKGKAPEGASRFSIYLQKGDEYEPANIPFVFDIRFNFGADQNKIVTNHKKEGGWGSEEGRDAHFPFETEKEFKIKIIVDDDSFKVKVDGETLLDYEQKLPDKMINCIRIDNNVHLTKVNLR